MTGPGRDDIRDTLAAVLASEREQLAQGICPRSGKRFMPNGNLRPACAFCDCGDERADALDPR